VNTTRKNGDLRAALTLILSLTLVTGVVYPVAITLLAGAVFPGAANGSLVARDGRVVGSHWIGQDWQGPEWFHGRPSATGERPYNPLPSSGSNLGPTNADLGARFTERAAALRDAPAATGPLPADLLTASSSGLDPHISPAAARLQAAGVAAARSLPVATVEALVDRTIEPPQFGVLGEARVNVLRLNLALDSLASRGVP
jgi:K+-transporting ATPase ATPase C chain